MRSLCLALTLSLASCSGVQITHDKCEIIAQRVGIGIGFARAACAFFPDAQKCQLAARAADVGLATYRGACGIIADAQ